ncbi:hypothetical protein GCM10010185_27000 [Saccharothrix coeruleofusca]|uniref:Uncharacterized protein n=1 Tax=Saccharothrix coeruleofusca TaxID=33919 RepID=A0A918AKL5_9PSEU|nr:hypothetical protein GCM10010185_27000 [Saccharothrix coeruleofusca]
MGCRGKACGVVIAWFLTGGEAVPSGGRAPNRAVGAWDLYQYHSSARGVRTLPPHRFGLDREPA